MLRSLTRIVLALMFLLCTVARTDAALIILGEGSTDGGGTITNDGTADVHGSDAGVVSLLSFTSLMSELGLTDVGLASGLAQLQFRASFTNPDVFEPTDPATSVTLSGLRLIGTIDLEPGIDDPPPNCSDCATPDQVRLGFAPVDNTTQNVLFAIPVIGTMGPMPWEPPGTPTHLAAQTNLQFGTNYFFSLKTDPDPLKDQVQFIVARMTASGYSVNQIRLGLAILAVGITDDLGPIDDKTSEELIRSELELQPIPEPATLVLFASGMAAVGVRRFRQTRRH